MNTCCICNNSEGLLSADNVANIISVISLIAGVVMFWIGRKEIVNYLKLKKESQIRAASGFHLHLLFFISRLKHLISAKNTENMDIPLYAVWYLLSGNVTLKEQGNLVFGKELKTLSNEINSYLCTAYDQVPPVNCKESDEKEWFEKIKSLQTYLVVFSSIESSPHAEYAGQDAIDKKWEELVNILDWIEGKIQNSLNSSLSDL
jgi:hypothetical protein